MHLSVPTRSYIHVRVHEFYSVNCMLLCPSKLPMKAMHTAPEVVLAWKNSSRSIQVLPCMYHVAALSFDNGCCTIGCSPFPHYYPTPLYMYNFLL